MRRRRRKKVPLQQEPRKFQLRFQTLLTKQRKTIEGVVEERLYPELRDILEEAELDRAGVRRDSARQTLAALFATMAEIVRRLLPQADAENELVDIAADTSRFQQEQLQRQFIAMVGIPIILPEPFIPTLLRGFVTDNVKGVVELQARHLSELERIVAAGLRQGLRVERITEQIQQHFNVSKSRASFWARDQIGKFYAELNEHRQRSVGIEEYVWDATDDERTRPTHRALNETIHSWNDPPVVDHKSGRQAHPGQDYQCRCQAKPRLPPDLLAAIDK